MKRPFMHERLGALIAVLLVGTAGFACSMLRPGPALTWHLLLQVDAPATDRVAAVRQTIFVIENRLQALGLSSWAVKVQGGESNGRLLVKLPEVPDRERVKRVITAGGKLELAHVISPPSPYPVQTYATKQEAIASLSSGGNIPENRRVLPYLERATPGNSLSSTRWVVVESPAIINGSDLRNAAATKAGREGDDYEIAFSLAPGGAAKFTEWTGANINEYLGVVLNDEVKSIAFIKSQITDSGVIEGRFTRQGAEDLALVLRSGALPAPVRIVEETSDK